MSEHAKPKFRSYKPTGPMKGDKPWGKSYLFDRANAPDWGGSVLIHTSASSKSIQHPEPLR